MSSLVVLGGADGAIATLRAARRIGLRTICVDLRADAPALRYADEFLNISTRDTRGLTEILSGRTDLVGVVSPASDVNLPTQRILARRLGLSCGLSPAALRASVDKGFCRTVCDRLGLPGPRFTQGRPEYVRVAADRIGYPLMVKPADSSGGRGVGQCHAPADLARAVRAAAAWSTSGIVIAEEYLSGAHYTAEAVVVDGRVSLFGLGRRVLTPPPHFVTVEHIMPAGPSGLGDQVRQMLDQVCAALDYRWGSLNVDLIVTDDGRCVLVELGARLGGNGSAELLGMVHGIDVTEASIRMAIGQRPSLRPVRSAHAAFRVLRSDRPGKLVAVRGDGPVRALPGVVDLVVTAAEGEDVEPYHRAGAKLGYLVVTAPDRDRLRATLARIDTLLRIDVAPPEELTAGHGEYR